MVVTVESSVVGTALSKRSSATTQWSLSTGSLQYNLNLDSGVALTGATVANGTRHVLAMRRNPQTGKVSTWYNGTNQTDADLVTGRDDTPFALVMGSLPNAGGSAADPTSSAWQGIMHALYIYPSPLLGTRCLHNVSRDHPMPTLRPACPCSAISTDVDGAICENNMPAEEKKTHPPI